MKYKTCARDKRTHEYKMIEMEAYTKAGFIKNVRHNGYSVNAKKVLSKTSYEFVMRFTNACESDWHEWKWMDMFEYLGRDRYFEFIESVGK